MGKGKTDTPTKADLKRFRSREKASAKRKVATISDLFRLRGSHPDGLETGVVIFNESDSASQSKTYYIKQRDTGVYVLYRSGNNTAYDAIVMDAEGQWRRLAIRGERIVKIPTPALEQCNLPARLYAKGDDGAITYCILKTEFADVGAQREVSPEEVTTQGSKAINLNAYAKVCATDEPETGVVMPRHETAQELGIFYRYAKMMGDGVDVYLVYEPKATEPFMAVYYTGERWLDVGCYEDSQPVEIKKPDFRKDITPVDLLKGIGDSKIAAKLRALGIWLLPADTDRLVLHPDGLETGTLTWAAHAGLTMETVYYVKLYAYAEVFALFHRTSSEAYAVMYEIGEGWKMLTNSDGCKPDNVDAPEFIPSNYCIPSALHAASSLASAFQRLRSEGVIQRIAAACATKEETPETGTVILDAMKATTPENALYYIKAMGNSKDIYVLYQRPLSVPCTTIYRNGSGWWRVGYDKDDQPERIDKPARFVKSELPEGLTAHMGYGAMEGKLISLGIAWIAEDTEDAEQVTPEVEECDKPRKRLSEYPEHPKGLETGTIKWVSHGSFYREVTCYVKLHDDEQIYALFNSGEAKAYAAVYKNEEVGGWYQLTNSADCVPFETEEPMRFPRKVVSELHTLDAIYEISVWLGGMADLSQKQIAALEETVRSYDEQKPVTQPESPTAGFEIIRQNEHFVVYRERREGETGRRWACEGEDSNVEAFIGSSRGMYLMMQLMKQYADESYTPKDTERIAGIILDRLSEGFRKWRINEIPDGEEGLREALAEDSNLVAESIVLTRAEPEPSVSAIALSREEIFQDELFTTFRESVEGKRILDVLDEPCAAGLHSLESVERFAKDLLDRLSKAFRKWRADEMPRGVKIEGLRNATAEDYDVNGLRPKPVSGEPVKRRWALGETGTVTLHSALFTAREEYYVRITCDAYAIVHEHAWSEAHAALYKDDSGWVYFPLDSDLTCEKVIVEFTQGDIPPRLCTCNSHAAVRALLAERGVIHQSFHPDTGLGKNNPEVRAMLDEAKEASTKGCENLIFDPTGSDQYCDMVDRYNAPDSIHVCTGTIDFLDDKEREHPVYYGQLAENVYVLFREGRQTAYAAFFKKDGQWYEVYTYEVHTCEKKAYKREPVKFVQGSIPNEFHTPGLCAEIGELLIKHGAFDADVKLVRDGNTAGYVREPDTEGDNTVKDKARDENDIRDGRENYPDELPYEDAILCADLATDDDQTATVKVAMVATVVDEDDGDRVVGVAVTPQGKEDMMAALAEKLGVVDVEIQMIPLYGDDGERETIMDELPVSPIEPLVDFVLIMQEDEEPVTEGGIHIPEASRDRKRQGVVLATGPGRWTNDGRHIPCGVKRGDRVLLCRTGGHERNFDGIDYIVVRPVDILGRLV